jgi:hypothetical protein
MWSGSNSGRPSGGAASMGYAGLVVWVKVEVKVGGRWLGQGFHLSSLSLDLFSSFHCKEKKKKKKYSVFLPQSN